MVYLDANVVIYAVQVPPVFGPRAVAHLSALRARGETLMLSDLTRMECLVGPLKSGNALLLQDYQSFFRAGAVRVVAVTAGVCDRAALIRAGTNFQAVDALHLAAAIEHGATRFLTSDTQLARFTGLPVDILP